ncbi:hypothetical protein SUGI_0693320 [Cryptomeria japonica]|nr:hypothetical protein SUGI_0693320 [Cryptomeria japonica]
MSKLFSILVNIFLESIHVNRGGWATEEMAQPDMPVYSSLKNEVNCGVQTECNVSDESWHIEMQISRPDSPNTSELKRHIEKERPPRHLLDLSRLVVNNLLISTSAESGIVVETEITGIAVESDRSGGNNDHGRCWRSMNMKLADRLRQLNSMNMFPCLDRNLSFNEVSIPSAYLVGQAGIEFKPGQLGFEKGISGKGFLMTPVGIRGSFNLVKDLRKQTILFAKSFLRRLHKYRVSFAQHSLTNFTCLLLKREIVEQV